MKYSFFFTLFCIILLNGGCKKDQETLKNTQPEIPEVVFPYLDTIHAITYNVAGLPEIISSGDPVNNTSEIGRRLNNYDLVNVQEDFNYNHFLYGTAKHTYKTKWSGPVPFGDGLNSMSSYKILNLKRFKWNKCNGTDCLTPKGFSYSQIELIEGVTIDLYNIHTNAGSEDAKDPAARRDNLIQVFKYIEKNSEDRPLIIMGDFNSRYTRTSDTLEIFKQLNLTDTWVDFMRDGIYPIKDGNSLTGCDDPSSANCETVDKIFFRSNEQVQFRILDYQKPRDEFQRDGKDLSDHIPVSTIFEIKILHK